ncbi:hypothetical protein JCM3774_006285 [Rhodotorula dairenensis]
MDSLFLGSARARRQINLGGSSHSGSHSDLVQQARRERHLREQERTRTKAASTLQAFYRGRQEAARSRHRFRTEYDRLVSPDARVPPTSDDFVTATRLLVVGAYRPGNPQDIKRLAAWCRTALKPPADAPAASTTASKPRRPTPLLFAPRVGPGTTTTAATWSVLTRTVARLLLTEATNNISLPQAPLFLEIVKILADPASYSKYTSSPSPPPPPSASASSATDLLLHLVHYGQLYPRVGHALGTIPPEQRTPPHPCLSPLLALALLPLRNLHPPRPTASASDSAATPLSSADNASTFRLLAAFARSVLTVPGLLAPGGRLTATQLAPFVNSAEFPLWDLLVALNGPPGAAPASSSGAMADGAQTLTTLSTEQTVALLANIVEMARGRLVVVAPAGGGQTSTSTAATAPAAAVGNGKQLVAYLEVLRRLLGQLPRNVLHQAEAHTASAESTKGKGKEVETIVIDEDDDDDEEDEDDDSDERESSDLDEDGTVRARRTNREGKRGGSRDQDGDESMMLTSDLEGCVAASSSLRRKTRAGVKDVRLDPPVRSGLAYLWSRQHLLALLALSTRYSASTRPALCGFFVELLVPSHAPTATATAAATTAGDLSTASPSSSSSRTVRDSILNTLLYSPLSSGLLRELFRGYIRTSDLGRTLASATKRERSAVVLHALKDSRYRDEWPVLVLAVEMYARSLLTMGDDEFYASTAGGGGGGGSNSGSGSANGRNPLSLDEVVTLSSMIRNATFALYWQDESGGDESVSMMVDPVAQQQQQTTRQQQHVAGMGAWSIEDVRGVMTRFLQQVHARDSRRSFTPEGHWHMTSAFDLRSFVETAVFEDERLEAEADSEPAGTGGVGGGAVTPNQALQASMPPMLRRGLARDTNDTRGPARSSRYSKRQLALISPRLGVLRNIPFVVPFETRVAIFRQFVANDFRKLGLGDATSYNARSRHRAVVRRTNLAEDAYAHLNGLGAELKKRIEIVFIDEHGMEESGIDGGGLFKELLTSLSKEVFDTNRGLWLATSEQELYPNPHGYAKESNQLSWFKFIGRILGKALYQGILVNVKFADFFLAKWLGRQSYLDDLASLDPELYNGLLKLKTYPGNVEEDLSLNFTITEEDFGVSRSVDLIPRGSEIAVTNENRMQYIVLVSNYRLNVQIAPQCRAFYSGLFEIINPRWLRMFNQSELAILVGGTEEAIDVEDLRRNTVYSGWAAEENTPTIRYFWEAVSSFSKEERAKLVRFVTACERPPLLGFSQLNPLFAIRNAGTDETRLPTSATCVNLLKLPEYSNPENLRQKLLYAINSGAGFDLS